MIVFISDLKTIRQAIDPKWTRQPELNESAIDELSEFAESVRAPALTGSIALCLDELFKSKSFKDGSTVIFSSNTAPEIQIVKNLVMEFGLKDIRLYVLDGDDLVKIEKCVYGKWFGERQPISAINLSDKPNEAK